MVDRIRAQLNATASIVFGAAAASALAVSLHILRTFWKRALSNALEKERAKGTSARFVWPSAGVLATSIVAQNFSRGLEKVPSELLALLGDLVVRSEILGGGGAGRKKRDDVLIELRSPVELGTLEAWQMQARERLAHTEAHRDRAHLIEFVPGSTCCGEVAIPAHYTVVVDTDALSQIFKGDTRGPGLLAAIKQHTRKVISFQTQAELYAWILLRHFSQSRIAALEKLLTEFEVVYPDQMTCLIWAQLMDHCRAQGRPGGPQDCWVAATALRHGARLCTGNRKDYDYLPGVQFVEPL